MAAVKQGSKIPYPKKWLSNPWHPAYDPKNPYQDMEQEYAWIGRSRDGANREMQGTHVPEVGPDGRFGGKNRIP